MLRCRIQFLCEYTFGASCCGTEERGLEVGTAVFSLKWLLLYEDSLFGVQCVSFFIKCQTIHIHFLNKFSVIPNQINSFVFFSKDKCSAREITPSVSSVLFHFFDFLYMVLHYYSSLKFINASVTKVKKRRIQFILS